MWISALGQAVRNSQALGLDKNIYGANRLDTEVRRRVWWELVICDVYVPFDNAFRYAPSINRVFVSQ